MTGEKQEDEKFIPEEKDIGLIEEITGKNREGLRKLGNEEKSQAYRNRNRYIRKVLKIYRRYLKKSEAKTQTIEA